MSPAARSRDTRNLLPALHAAAFSSLESLEDSDTSIAERGNASANHLCARLSSSHRWRCPLRSREVVANRSNFPEAFRGLFAVGGDTRNRDYSCTNGWNAPKCEYRRTRQSDRENIEKIC